MLIGNVLEKTPAEAAWQLCADKLAERDFILGIYRVEDGKREVNREEFRGAFAKWKELFEQL